MNAMTYKGYHAKVEYDARDDIFVGQLLGIRTIVSFHGRSIAELQRELRQAVNDYLAYCNEQGIEPQRPSSGRVLLRLSSDLHRRAQIKAESEGLSFNQWVTIAIENALPNTLSQPR